MIGAAFLVLALAQSSQATLGELHVRVRDASGAPVHARVDLVSAANQLHQSFDTDAEGALVARRLPLGAYRVNVTRVGFAPFAGSVDVRSAVPFEYVVTLSVAAVQVEVTVTPPETLIDPQQTGAVHRLGAEALQRRMSALPGRALPDLVNTQPGWLLEANGILHPRGSEYQTQFVIDGLPLSDNRSPAFAPEIEADDVHAMSVLTGGYPAEYGRKLGGIIEVVTAADAAHGFHGSVSGALGSFATRSGDAAAAYTWPHATLGISAGASATDRYLDPPVEDNFSNHGTTSRLALHAEGDLTANDRIGAAVRHGDAAFLVPNERAQEQAGQRQTRASSETAGQFSYQHVFAAPIVADVRGLVRDLTADLASNAASTPIVANQARAIRDGYLKATVSARAGPHDLKAGGDVIDGTVNEAFDYRITNRPAFDRDTLHQFAFADRRTDREQSLFVQDHVSAGGWTVNAGLRWDHYSLVADEMALSPRLSVAWARPEAGLVLRASYDRAFQTPAVENLLLASSPAVDVLNDTVLRLPVRPSRGNFYETSVAKSLGRVVRLDVSYFERHMSDFADDDVLLNTGVSFPIAFDHAEIRGTEVTLDVRNWKRLTASASYGWQRGVGELPITGGLFLGDEATSLLTSTAQFPVSQDQRQTIRGRASCQATSVLWTAVAMSYGSGLPVEFDGTVADAVAQYGQRIVDRVDFATGRVRPSFSLDASAGIVVSRSASRRVSIQIDARNLTGRLNVINFAGLFSGTALAPPRGVAARIRADW